MLDNLADQSVSFSNCTLATLNKVRAWARRNKAFMKSVSRYATDAYEGVVTIPSPWNEHASVAVEKRRKFMEAFPFICRQYI